MAHERDDKAWQRLRNRVYHQRKELRSLNRSHAFMKQFYENQYYNDNTQIASLRSWVEYYRKRADEQHTCTLCRLKRWWKKR